MIYNPKYGEESLEYIKEDIFLRVDYFRDKPWYNELQIYTSIGVCKTTPEYALDMRKALKRLGYSTEFLIKDGEIYICPMHRKNPRETEVR